MTNFGLHDEQTLNRFRKITWASICHYLFETAAYIYIHIDIDIQIYIEIQINISIYIYICIFLYGKQKFVFLGRQMIHGNRLALFQQMCPSMCTLYVGQQERIYMRGGDLTFTGMILFPWIKGVRVFFILFSLNLCIHNLPYLPC